MLAIRANFNGRDKKTAVAERPGHISASVMMWRYDEDQDAHFYLHGVDGEGAELTWMSKQLQPGDRIVIEVIEVEKWNKPRKKPAPPPEYAEAEREAYDRAQYERLKHKYESTQNKAL